LPFLYFSARAFNDKKQSNRRLANIKLAGALILY